MFKATKYNLYLLYGENKDLKTNSLMTLCL